MLPKWIEDAAHVYLFFGLWTALANRQHLALHVVTDSKETPKAGDRLMWGLAGAVALWPLFVYDDVRYWLRDRRRKRSVR